MLVKTFVERRKQLAQTIGEDAIALISANRMLKRNGDVHYRFRQNSDFYYLTGFNEPDAVLIIQGGKSNGHSTLFNLPKNTGEAQWIGERLGQEGAVSHLKVQEAFALTDLESKLPALCQHQKKIYYAIGTENPIESLILKIVSQHKARGPEPTTALFPIAPLLGKMRLFKSVEEITCMQKAADISVQGHLSALQQVKNASFEYELEAQLIYQFTQAGCRDVAYDAIVAGGKNACILHYTDNHAPLKKGELVLIDAACEYQNYAADITRTFPVNGRFSPPQRSLYELVLSAQQAAIDKIKPGLPWKDLQATIVNTLTQGLLDLKLLKGSLSEAIETHAYKRFYMHSSGHWLGLDVHDVGGYENPLLAPNMVLTVEPGLYITEHHDIPKPFWNTGIRIEDDILVTKTGHHNLSQKLPRAITEIEAIIHG